MGLSGDTQTTAYLPWPQSGDNFRVSKSPNKTFFGPSGDPQVHLGRTSSSFVSLRNKPTPLQHNTAVSNYFIFSHFFHIFFTWKHVSIFEESYTYTYSVETPYYLTFEDI